MKLSFIIPMYIEEFDIPYMQVLTFWNEVARKHEVIIVDDGSPNRSAPFLPQYFTNINFERIKENIPWNQPAARNLGAAVASGDILVFTDFDHIFETKDFSVIIDNFKDKPNGKTYLFNRIKDGKSIHHHPCSFAILRDDFRGFDESFCGHYGYDDTEFINRHKPIGILPLSTIVAIRKTTHSLKRDTTENIKKI